MADEDVNLPELETQMPGLEKAILLESLMSSNNEKLGKFSAMGQQFAAPDLPFVLGEILELLYAVLRAGWGEDFLTDLRIAIEEKKALTLEQAERQATASKLLNPLLPQQNGNRQQRRHM